MILDFFDKIYYINLDEDINKKEYFEQEITKSSISKICKKYPAVAGKNLDIRLVPDGFISESAKVDILLKQQKTYGVSLTFGSLGCALSHYFIYKECSQSKKPFLIFEDDIIIDNSFDNKLTNVLKDLNNHLFDILYLGYNEIPGFNKVKYSSFLSKPSGLITGMYAYIISPFGAQKLIKHIFPLDRQIDSSISHNLDKFTVFCSTDKVVNVRVDFGSKTQQSESCNNSSSYGIFDNHIMKNDNWNKLFI